MPKARSRDVLPVARCAQLFAVGVIPLVYHLKVVPLEGDRRTYWTGASESWDFFCYYKSGLTVLAAVLAAAAIALSRSGREFPPQSRRIVRMLCGFAVLVTASALLSRHPQLAFLGFAEHYEGAPVVIAYVVLALVGAVGVTTASAARALLVTLYVSAALIGILGLLQYCGHDFFATSFGRQLILTRETRPFADRLTFSNPPFTSIATLYNSNYMGSYMAMLLPVSVVAVVSATTTLAVSGAFGLACLSFANLFGSHSRAGIVGAMAGLALVATLAFSRQVAGRVVLLALCFTVIGAVMNRIEHGFTARKVGVAVADLRRGADTDPDRFRSITRRGDRIRMETQRGTFFVGATAGSLVLEDDQGRPIPTSVVGAASRLADPRFQAVSVVRGRDADSPCLRTRRWKLCFLLDGERIHVRGVGGRLVEPEDPPRWGFEGREAAMSGRAFVWSRSAALLPGAFVLGYGPDTFGALFPQNDIAGLLNAGGEVSKIFDRPHSFYLQTALATGVVSLVLLVAATTAYAAKAVAWLREHREWSWHRRAALSALAGTAGYLAAGTFNDSVPGVAPVFWTLFGAGTGLLSFDDSRPIDPHRDQPRGG